MMRRFLRPSFFQKLPFRLFSSPFSSDTEYINVSNSFLEAIFDQIETAELPFIEDIELVDGVLNIKYETDRRKGEYVLNRQRPNHQIWMSSPLSGPYRFDFDKEKKEWVNANKGVEIVELLNQEIKEIDPESSFVLKPEV